VDQSFGKRYSLRSKKTIDSLFSEGIRISAFPFMVWVSYSEFKDTIPFKMVFSAPKKKFRRAVQRNRIKRICREAVRKEKEPLEHYLVEQNKQLAVFLVYTGQEELDHAVLSKKTAQLMTKIIHTLDEQVA